MDPDSQGEKFSVFLQELDVSDGRFPHSKTLLERIKEWRIADTGTVQLLSENLVKKNRQIQLWKKAHSQTRHLEEMILQEKKEIHVLKQAHAVAPQLRKGLEIEIALKNNATEVLKRSLAKVPQVVKDGLENRIMQDEAERDRLQIQLLKGKLFEKFTQVEGLEKETEELTKKLVENNLEVEDLRRKAKEQETRDKLQIQILKGKLFEKFTHVEGLEKETEELTNKLVQNNLEVEDLRRKTKEQETLLQEDCTTLVELIRELRPALQHQKTKGLKQVESTLLELEALNKRLCGKKMRIK